MARDALCSMALADVASNVHAGGRSGRTLYDLLPSRAAGLEPQIDRARRTLHDANPPIIHGDDKSANVLLDANPYLCLGDFAGLPSLRMPKTTGANSVAAAPAPVRTLGYLYPAYVTPESVLAPRRTSSASKSRCW